jgi:hypothetical protein
MGKRWERLGIKFDNQTVPSSNPDLERACGRVMDFTSLINPKRRSNK